MWHAFLDADISMVNVPKYKSRTSARTCGMPFLYIIDTQIRPRNILWMQHRGAIIVLAKSREGEVRVLLSPVYCICMKPYCVSCTWRDLECIWRDGTSSTMMRMCMYHIHIIFNSTRCPQFTSSRLTPFVLSLYHITTSTSQPISHSLIWYQEHPPPQLINNSNRALCLTLVLWHWLWVAVVPYDTSSSISQSTTATRCDSRSSLSQTSTVRSSYELPNPIIGTSKSTSTGRAHA